MRIIEWKSLLFRLNLLFLIIVNIRRHKWIILLLHQVIFQLCLIRIRINQWSVQGRLLEIFLLFNGLLLIRLVLLLNLVLDRLLETRVFLNKLVLLSRILLALEILAQEVCPFLVKLWRFLFLPLWVQSRRLGCYSLVHNPEISILFQVLLNLCGLCSWCDDSQEFAAFRVDVLDLRLEWDFLQFVKIHFQLL
jgi:hypothetical protein